MQIRDLLNPDTHLKMAYKGFVTIMLILVAVPVFTKALPFLGPLFVLGAIAYVFFRRSGGEKRSSGERRTSAGAERTPLMPQGRGDA